MAFAVGISTPKVTPNAGVRIETAMIPMPLKTCFKSHPMRVRELKPVIRNLVGDYFISHPVRVLYGSKKSMYYAP